MNYFICKCIHVSVLHQIQLLNKIHRIFFIAFLNQSKYIFDDPLFYIFARILSFFILMYFIIFLSYEIYLLQIDRLLRSHEIILNLVYCYAKMKAKKIYQFNEARESSFVFSDLTFSKMSSFFCRLVRETVCYFKIERIMNNPFTAKTYFLRLEITKFSDSKFTS